MKKLLLILSLALVSGCGYKAGTLLPSNIKTIYVEPFTNQTALTGVEAPLTNAIINEIQQNGSLQIVDKEIADAVLSGKVVAYRRDPVVLGKNEAAREYKGVMIIHAVLKGVKDTSLSIDMPYVEGSTEFYVGAVPPSKIAGTPSMSGRERVFGGATLPEAERNSMSAIINDAAKNVVQSALEGGW